MAIVYLQLVTRGLQELDAIDTTISEAMEILQTQIPTYLLPALVSVVYSRDCCKARRRTKIFRNIFSSPSLMDPVFKHRERVLPILEEISNRRQTTSSFAWEDSLELTRIFYLFEVALSVSDFESLELSSWDS
jgi:hypothetical protein